MKIKIPFILLFLVSCSQKKEQSRPNSFAPKVEEAKGYIVPKDSMATPKSVLAGKPKVVAAGKPTVVTATTNIHLAGIPKTVIAGTPKICTPGKDSCLFPKVKKAINRSFVAGIPEVVMAKDPGTRDQNAQNFSSFTKLHGLKGDAVTCMLQDKNGNIWIGTWAGGVSRYDGKNFTHFTEKEGLSNYEVLSILEDRSGNLWFGAYGVSKYDGKHFTQFPRNEGLSKNFFHSIIEDKSGNLWFGTDEGASKYDGKYFTHYTEKEGLSNNMVRSIFEDRSGNFWFGTYGGVSKYDGKTFTQFTEKEGLSNNIVLDILEDVSGNLWFGTYGGGVSKYDGKHFTHYTEKEGLSNNMVWSIFEDRSGNLWFGTIGGGVSKYDGKYFTHFTEEEGLVNNIVNSILEDRSGNLWFGTEGGVSKYSGKTFTHFTRTEGLSNNDIRSIFEDKSGNLWLGTEGGGLSKYDGKSFTHLTEKEGLGGVMNILEDRSGNLWFNTYGRGVSKYDGKSFTLLTEKEGLSNNNVITILQDQAGNLWYGHVEGGVTKYDGKHFTYYTEKEGLQNNSVLSMLEGRTGNLWFGHIEGGLTKYDGKDFTHFTITKKGQNNNVFSILEDKSGNIWFGSEGGGLSKYDGETFTHFTEKEGLSSDEVSSILEDRTGNLWFGTAFGLNKLSAESLLKLSVNAMPTVPVGREVAIGTADKAGLSDLPNNYRAGEVFFKSYSYEDGFLGIGCNRNAIFEDKNGTIWIGANDRLTAYHPEGDKSDTIAPNMQLTGVALFNETIPWANLEQKKDTSIVLGNGVSVGNFKFDGIAKWYNVPEQLSLSYNNNHLTFSFIGITTNSPKKVKYQYKLEGLDKNWSAFTTRTEADYGSLPPGNYSFKVKAMNSEGYWSKEINYSFTIRPPWWGTWWFRIIAVIFVVAILYGLIRWRLHEKFRRQLELSEKEKKLAGLQRQKTELEMQALRAQMNPHFISNSLNSINIFILENNRLQASDYLSKFSKLVRLILENSQEAFIPLERELESLRLYLELESLRFEEKFEYKISVHDDVDTGIIKVPPLIIQPYAENAIWHGLMHLPSLPDMQADQQAVKKEKGHLGIELYLKDNILFCKITDNGIGRKKAAELKSKSSLNYKSMGMKLTEDRMALLQQEQKNSFVTVTDLVFPDGHPAGTEVLIKIPLCYD